MLKKSSQFFGILFFCIFNLFVLNASAIDLDEATRTVVADSSGNTTVLSPEQVKRGKRLFNATCGACHVGGVTKTNPNVGFIWKLCSDECGKYSIDPRTEIHLRLELFTRNVDKID